MCENLSKKAIQKLVLFECKVPRNWCKSNCKMQRESISGERYQTSEFQKILYFLHYTGMSYFTFIWQMMAKFQNCLIPDKKRCASERWVMQTAY